MTDSPRHDLEHIEREIVNAAHHITVTSQLTREVYEERYPTLRDKFSVFPNVYDDAYLHHHPVATKRKKKLSLLYLGNFYGKRNPRIFLDCLSELCAESSSFRDKIALTFAGCFDRLSAKEIERISSEIETKNLGQISFQTCLELQKAADLLLVIDKPRETPMDDVFLPSKLLDYTLAKRPILALTSPTSETWAYVKRGYGFVADQAEPERVKGVIREILERFESNEDLLDNLAAPAPDYSASLNARRLTSLIQSLSLSQPN